MKQIRDCTDPATWWPHLDEAATTLAAGGLVVIPTDTVYGIAADAFNKYGVDMLLAAKRRGRAKPPPVLVGEKRTALALASEVSPEAEALMDKFWPGPLTIVVKAQASLAWDLGETNGTVALRMPAHECALALLRKTGPLAVSSANRTDAPPARSALAAHRQLGTSVRVYLDAGESGEEAPSTIVDATGSTLRILREGALSAEDLGIPEEVAQSPAEAEG